MISPIVGAEVLEEAGGEPTTDRLAGPPSARRIVVADVRWYLDGRDDRSAYEAGHVPGAVFVDLDHDLSDHTQPATAGRHPLPTAEAFAAAMSRLGIGDGDTVVAYDDSGGGSAGRLVVMLRWLGVDAALLDGGIAAWPGDLETGAGTARPPATFSARPWPAERFVDADEVGALAAGGAAGTVVLDARSAERFRGESEPVDPRPGHIPGARNAPWQDNLGATGTFAGAEALRARFAGLGVTEATDVVCYCGSGVSACALLLALERAGVTRTRLYAPSWSGWSADPSRPAAVGR